MLSFYSFLPALLYRESKALVPFLQHIPSIYKHTPLTSPGAWISLLTRLNFLNLWTVFHCNVSWTATQTASTLRAVTRGHDPALIGHGSNPEARRPIKFRRCLGARVHAHALSLSCGYCAYPSDKLHQAECQLQSTGSLPGFWQQWSNAMPLPTISRLFRSALRTQLVSVANVTTKPAKHTVTAGVSSYSLCELYMPEAGVLSRLKSQRFLINSNRLNFIARSFALLNLNSSSSASHTHILTWYDGQPACLTNSLLQIRNFFCLYTEYCI